MARVAWPHSPTSAAGVNQRSAQSASPPSGSGCANAVSERFTSAATRWSQLVGGEAEAGAGGVRVQEHDAGGIAGEGAVGEGVDGSDPHGPGR